MGLDIHIGVNNNDEVYSHEYHGNDELFNLHSLSRTFCNLMCRQHVIGHLPELDQVGKIAGVDISIFYDMEGYPEDFDIEEHLASAETEAEKQSILENVQEIRNTLEGNIDLVISTLNQLISKLNGIDNLPSLLLPTDFETLDSKNYFSDFTKDIGEGYIGNNFGQDLRNFKRFLEYAKERGTKTVWFSYG